MKSDRLRKLQEKELQILIEYDKICRKMGLDYSLAFGTLLGAVRHHGFIPWDSDIDTLMLRENYSKFIDQAPKLLPKNLFLQTYETDKNFPKNFAKIRDTSTSIKFEYYKHLDFEDGICIDVVPIDAISSNRFIRAIDNLLLYSINIIKSSKWKSLERFNVNDKNSKNRFKNKIKRYTYKLVKSFGTKKINKLETKIKARHNKKGTQLTYCGKRSIKTPIRLNSSDIISMDIFQNYELIEFEDRMFKTIKDRDTILTHWYGNYMKPPPKEERTQSFYELKFNESD